MTACAIDKKFPRQGRITAKAAAVMRMFGLDVDRLSETALRHKCAIELNPGQICYITGPSGAGKSVLLRELMEKMGIGSDESASGRPDVPVPIFYKCIDLDAIPLSSKRAVIDCIDGNFIDALKILSLAGLSDVFAVLNKPAFLSDGQKYRFRLAKALSSVGADLCVCPPAVSHKIIFADEFCSNLDRITAAVIAYQIRKFATRYNVTFVLASSHEDILADLRPDIMVIKHLNGKTEVIYKHVHHNPAS
jgi:ABC-type ATPase with predicted acetyltransferase domain